MKSKFTQMLLPKETKIKLYIIYLYIIMYTYVHMCQASSKTHATELKQLIFTKRV